MNAGRLAFRPRRGLSVLAAVVAVLGLAACESYLSEPGQGEPEAPILENVSLSPATLTVLDAPGDLNTAVDARTRSGIDGVTVILKSPSGNDRLSCDMSAPAEGDAFDGQWRCDLTVAQGSESGMWEPDSIGVFSAGAEGGVRYFTRDELAEAGYEVEVEIISEPPVPTELTVTPASAELPGADSQVTLVATVLDQYGREIQDPAVVWTSEDPAIAAVSGTGVVTPVSVGATAVVATLDALSDTATIVVPSTPTTLEVTPASVALDAVGATAQLAAEVRNQFDDVLAGETVTWTSADPSVATVDDTGLVTAVSGGVTTVQAEAAGLTADVLVTVDGGQPLPGFTWTNLAGGDWNDPANWDRGAVPGPADTAFIRLDGSYTVTVGAAASVAVLEVESTSGRPRLEVAAGTFTVADSAWFGPGSTAALRAGEWGGAGAVVVADSLVWTGGTLTGTGTTRLTATGSLAATGAGTRIVEGRSLLLEGPGRVEGGAVDLTGAAEVTVAAGAVLEVGGATVTSSSTGAQLGRLVVDGALVQPASLGDVAVAVRLVNNGSVSVGDGRLFLIEGAGGFQGGGQWTVADGATLRTTGTPAVAEIGTGGSVQGAGTWEVRADAELRGAVNLDGGIDVADPGVALRIESADTARVGTLRIGNGGIVDLAAGAAVRVQDTFDVGPGSAEIAGAGSIVLPSSANGTLAATGDAVLRDGAELVAGGFVTWEQGGLVLSNGARIRVTPEGTFVLATDGTLQSLSGALGGGTIENEGSFERFVATGVVTVQPDLVNRGRVAVATGTLDLDGGFTHASGARLRGAGTLDLTDSDPVSFQGDLGPGLDFGDAAGALTVQGNLALTGTSTLRLELGGTAAGTDADLLDVSGTFTAAGTLDVSGLSGYQPAAGDTLEVLRYGSRAGAFDAVTGLDFAVAGGGEPLDTVFEADRLLLVAPDPVAGDPTGVVVFGSSRTGNREIFVKDVETGAVTQLTSLGRFAAGPRVAPDGSRIVFSDNADEILLINSDGSGLRSLTGPPGDFRAGAPAWSPDGTRIVYQGAAPLGEDWEIVTVSVADTTDRVQLTDNLVEEQYPNWSPDGSRIVYVETDASSTRRIVSIRASDGGDRIEHFTGSPRYPRWSPDGTEMVFYNLTGNGFEIRILDVATGDSRVVVPDGDLNTDPAWSPDGRFLVYVNGGDLFYISVAGGTPTLLESSSGFEQSPDWAAGLTPPSGAPTALISSPTSGSTFTVGETVLFQGSATDPEDGSLTGARLVWSSNLDGGLGTGETLSTTDLSAGDHVVTLTATDSDGNTGTAQVDVRVVDGAPGAQADLSVAMTVTPDPVTVGDTLIHTVTVTNGGPQAADSVELTLLIEGDVLFALVEEQGCGNFTSDSPPERLFQCPVGTLAPGADTTYTLRVLPQAAETLTSTAEISDFTGAVDANTANNRIVETTTVQAAAVVRDLALVRYSMAPDPVTVDGRVLHTVVFRNDGTEDIANLVANIRTNESVAGSSLRPFNCTGVSSGPSTPGGFNCFYSGLNTGTPLLPGAVDSFQVSFRPTELGEITGSVSLDITSGGAETEFSNNNGVDTVQAVAYNLPLSTVIESPQDGEVYESGEAIPFDASVRDAQDVDLRGGQVDVEWESSIDGVFLGTPLFDVDYLSPGIHDITLRVLDGTTVLDSAQVQIEVQGFVNLRGGIGAFGFGAGFGPSYNTGDSVPMFLSVNNLEGPDTEPNPVVTITATGAVQPLGDLPPVCTTETLMAPAGLRWTCDLPPLGPFTGSSILQLPFEPLEPGTLTLDFEITGDFQETNPADNTETETTEIVRIFQVPAVGQFTYVSERDGVVGQQVWIQNLETGSLTQLTTGSAVRESSALSPDGTRVAYSEGATLQDDSDVIIRNTDGTGTPVVIPRTGTYPGIIAWSPDGSQIAYDIFGPNGQEIYIADPNSPDPGTLLATDYAKEPNWSPDGSRIAFIDAGRGFAGDLVTVRASDGLDRQVLVTNPTGFTTIGNPEYSPDGTQIALVLNREIIVVDVATGATRTVVPNTAAFSPTRPTWSPDGTAILYEVGSEIQVAPVEGADLPGLVDDAGNFLRLGNWIGVN